MFKKWKYEIKTIGLKDWWWFCIWHRRDEYLPSLDNEKYQKVKMRAQNLASKLGYFQPSEPYFD
jgi:hypothetical protein